MLREHGVPIAPSSYYAARGRPPSARSVCDAQLLGEIQRVDADPRLGRSLSVCLYGAREVLHRCAGDTAWTLTPAGAGPPTTPANRDQRSRLIGGHPSAQRVERFHIDREVLFGELAGPRRVTVEYRGSELLVLSHGAAGDSRVVDVRFQSEVNA